MRAQILIMICVCAGVDMAVAQARVAPGLHLAWPVLPDPNTSAGSQLDLGQAYAEKNAVVKNQYHSGIDINGVSAGTPVFAAAPGFISKIQLLDTSCLQASACEDHGLGNTVIVKHIVGNTTVYTQYSQLDSIPSFWVQLCGPLDKGKKFRRTCSNIVPIDSSAQIGTVGGSGYGQLHYWPTHLHFELKDVNYLGDIADDGSTVHWGYTPTPPDTDNYHDPVLNLSSAFDLAPSLSVLLNANSPLRVGPGGLDEFGVPALTSDSGYFRSASTLSQGTSYSATRYAPGSTAGTCQSGWFEIIGSFPDPVNGLSATVASGWLCADSVTSVGRPLSPSILVSPAMINQGDTFTDIGSGFSANGNVTENISHPAGMTVYGTRSDAVGQTSDNHALLSEQGTYTEIDVDDLTGSTSNATTWTVAEPPAPFALTLPATNIASSSAALNGTVNPSGSTGNVFFNWGTDPNALNGGSLLAGYVTADSTTQAFTVTLPLIAATKYYYQIVFYGVNGTQTGQVLGFTSLPQTATTHVFTAITTSGAALNGTVNPNGSTGSVFFNWGTDANASNGGSVLAGYVTANNTTQPFTVTLSLATFTTYYYQVVFYGTGGTTTGAIVTFKTLPTPTVTKPAANITSASAALSGTVNPNGSTGSVFFNWGTDPNASNGGSVLAGYVTANNTVQTFAVTLSLASFTTYYYQVVFNGTGGTTTGAIVTFKTLATPTITTAPTNITSLGAALNGTVNPYGSSGSVFFNWGTDSMASNGGSLSAGSVTANKVVQPFSVTLSLATATTYYYRILFYGAGGMTAGKIVSFKTLTTPTVTIAPTNTTSNSAVLNGTVNPNGSTGSVFFNWGTDPNASNGGSSFSGYTTPNNTVQPFSLALPVASATTYYYQIIFYGAGGTATGKILRFTTLLSNTSAQTILTQFDGDIGTGSPTYKDHPDMSLASNGSQLVEATGQNINVYNYVGTLLQSTRTGTFIANAGLTTGQVNDPRVVYDPFINRWIIGCSCSRDYLMVSATSDATGTWKGVQLTRSTGDLSMYPAFDRNGVYVSEADPVNGGAQVIAIPAADTAWNVGGNISLINEAVFTGKPNEIKPAIDLNNTKAATDPEYLVTRDGPGPGQIGINVPFNLVIDKIVWSGTTASYSSGAKVASGYLYNTPKNVSQASNPNIKGTESNRVLSAQMFGATDLHLTLGSGPCTTSATACGSQGIDSHDIVLWFDIATPALTLTQSAKMSNGVLDFLFPSLAVDSFGNVLIVGSAAASAQPASIYIWYHRASDPAGFMHGPELATAGTTAYACNATNPVGWGTYSTTVTDTSDQTKFWAVHEYANNSTSCQWYTRLLNFQLQSPGG